MLDKQTLDALQCADAAAEVNTNIARALAGNVAAIGVPDSFNIQDMEQFQPHRRRAKGEMYTNSVADFVDYCKAHKTDGATVFVTPEMDARCVLNFGTPEHPGHADNVAKLGLTKTASYAAMLRSINTALRQSYAAEFVEDWQDFIKCLDDVGNEMRLSHVVEAFRTITIEALRKMESNVSDFEQSHGTLDAVKASASQKLPSRIVFVTKPYKDLQERRFELRVGIQTTDKPAVLLRIIREEDHQQEMAEELVCLLKEQFADTMPVHIGKYTKQ